MPISQIVTNSIASGQTITSPVIAGTPTGVGVLTSGTVVTASGTSISFTDIPSWVKRVTVMFNNVSLSTTASYLIQIGNTTPTTSGYSSIAAYSTNAVGYGALTSASGFVAQAGDPAYQIFGSLTINNLSGNIWVGTGAVTTATGGLYSSGGVTISGTLTGIRITSVTPDTFDAGSINILYE